LAIKAVKKLEGIFAKLIGIVGLKNYFGFYLFLHAVVVAGKE